MFRAKAGLSEKVSWADLFGCDSNTSMPGDEFQAELPLDRLTLTRSNGFSNSRSKPMWDDKSRSMGSTTGTKNKQPQLPYKENDFNFSEFLKEESKENIQFNFTLEDPDTASKDMEVEETPSTGFCGTSDQNTPMTPSGTVYFPYSPFSTSESSFAFPPPYASTSFPIQFGNETIETFIPPERTFPFHQTSEPCFSMFDALSYRPPPFQTHQPNQPHRAQKTNNRTDRSRRRPKKCVAKKAPKRLTDSERLQRRKRQIDFGKATEGYGNYIRRVSKQNRLPEHPQTPDITKKSSKRTFDKVVRKWRRDLHAWDSCPPSSGRSIASNQTMSA